MSWVAVAIAGGAIISGAMSSGAASDAAAQQASAANNATAQQQAMFNTINQQGAPQREAGYSALNSLLYGLGIGGQQTGQPVGTTPGPQQYPQAAPQSSGNWQSFDAGPEGGITMYRNLDTGAITNRPPDLGQQAQTQQPMTSSGQMVGAAPSSELGYGQLAHTFNANDLKTNLAPNYQFMLDQGQGAFNNAANAGGGRIGGNALQGLEKYTQDYASNAYQNAFSNYTGQQQNIFNRLSTIAGFGNTSNSTVASAGSAISPGISSSIQAGGAAQAAGTVGSANALSGGINAAGSYPLLSQIFGRGGISGGGTQIQSGSVPNTSEEWLPT